MIKAVKISFAVSIILTFFCTIIALSCIIVFPWVHHIPTGLAYLSGALGILWILLEGRFRPARILLAAVTGFFLWIVISVVSFILFVLICPRQNHQEFLSPNGEYTLVMENDFMDIPTVYRKQNAVFMSYLIRPDINAYNETIAFSIEWMTENQFKLYSTRYPDEDFWIVNLP